jgi:hypothetical protein
MVKLSVTPGASADGRDGTLTFSSVASETEQANSVPMDALLLGPAIVASFGVSLLTGKLVLRVFMNYILR